MRPHSASQAQHVARGALFTLVCPFMRWPSLAQRFGTLVLTPLRFSLQTGHARSSLVRRAVAPSGAPLPWLTYPAIDLLANVDVVGRSVLEFGAGQSTLWWLSHGAEVISFDD